VPVLSLAIQILILHRLKISWTRLPIPSAAAALADDRIGAQSMWPPCRRPYTSAAADAQASSGSKPPCPLPGCKALP
jgi:hypothetical protein